MSNTGKKWTDLASKNANGGATKVVEDFGASLNKNEFGQAKNLQATDFGNGNINQMSNASAGHAMATADPTSLTNQNVNALSNDQLVAKHKELATKVRAEETNILMKKDYLTGAIQAKSFMNKNRKTDDIDSKVLFAGNVGDINSIVWPYFFQSKMQEIAPDGQEVLNINITQEAPFCLVGLQKVVFKETSPDVWEYVNPKATTGAGADEGLANGLKFTIVDTQSGRSWFESPISLDHIGDGKDMYKLPSPQLMLNNSNTEIQLFNQGSATYKVGVLFIGYRVRVEDAQNILSLVTE